MSENPQPQKFQSFRETHCMRCQAGFVRTIEGEPTSLICLINREPVPKHITFCNKFKQVVEV